MTAREDALYLFEDVSNKTLFSLFTTLYDDEVSKNRTIIESTAIKDSSVAAGDHSILLCAPSNINDSSGRVLNRDPSVPPRTRRKTKPRSRKPSLPGLICFYSTTGESVDIPRRSAFSTVRKAEVYHVRKRGACLRCSLRKITCSGEDPCKPCTALAQACQGSKALGWMECIRPSLQAISIFTFRGDTLQPNSRNTPTPTRLADVVYRFTKQSDAMDVQFPCESDISSISQLLANWLICGTNRSDFSVLHILRSNSVGGMLQQALDKETSVYLRLLVFLTNNVLNHSANAKYQQFGRYELEKVGEYLGQFTLAALDKRLKPASLERSDAKIQNMQALFIIVLALSVTARCTYLDLVLAETPIRESVKRNTEAFIRLLNHYLVYLAKASKLVDTASEGILTAKLRFQWDAPGSLVMKLSNDDFERSASTDWLHRKLSFSNISFYSDKNMLNESYSDPYTSGFDYPFPYIYGFENSGFQNHNLEFDISTDWNSRPRFKHWTFINQAEPLIVYNVATQRILMNLTEERFISGTPTMVDDSDLQHRTPKTVKESASAQPFHFHCFSTRTSETDLTVSFKDGGIRGSAEVVQTALQGFKEHLRRLTTQEKVLEWSLDNFSHSNNLLSKYPV